MGIFAGTAIVWKPFLNVSGLPGRASAVAIRMLGIGEVTLECLDGDVHTKCMAKDQLLTFRNKLNDRQYGTILGDFDLKVRSQGLAAHCLP